MKILIIMDPGILIPVKGYGGHERLVEMFAKEYHMLGHEVHLLITGGSTVEGCTVHDFGRAGFPPKRKDAYKAIPVAWRFLWKRRNEFDLIHNFGRLVYLLPLLRHPVKKIMTYGREISNRNVRLFHGLNGKNIVYTACSGNLLSRVTAQGRWEVVYNAIEFSKYSLASCVPTDAPLIFLGRIERVKGCHTAIRVAKAAGCRLLIAGNISPLPIERLYFEKEIKPYIDGRQIQYLGPLNDEEKNKYLGMARALLFPIEWNEPFGIVMIEAMACGTPVIGFNRGSVDEVIDQGITGIKVTGFEEMVASVQKIADIDRAACRQRAYRRFDVVVIAQRYLALSNNQRRKIVIVTTGQPAANPRVVKEYDALTKKGYRVNTLYTYSAEWSYKIDESKYFSKAARKQDYILIGGNPYTSKIHYFISRVQYKILSGFTSILPLPFLREMTISRSSLYLWIFASRFKADVYIAHYLGALPAAIKAASKYGGSVIFDAEDYHRGEEPYHASQIQQVIDIEDRLLPKVNVITAASPLICLKYAALYPGKKTITINNAFSRTYLQQWRPANEALRLFWFSQNIGPNRGLEIIIEAMNLIDFDLSLTLLGNIRDTNYLDRLLKMSNKAHMIQLMAPVPPEQIFKIAAGFDIGIAAEIPYCENRNVCLTNKIFTYLLAGNCVLASDTDAQKDLMEQYPQVGMVYRHNDPADLAGKIRLLAENREFLENCRKASTDVAARKLNWETEREKLYSVIEELASHDH